MEALTLSMGLLLLLTLLVLRLRHTSEDTLLYIEEFGLLFILLVVLMFPGIFSSSAVRVIWIGSLGFYVIGFFVNSGFLSWKWAVVLQSFVVYFLTYYGLRIDFIIGFDGGLHYLGWYSIPFTVLWVVLVSNSIGLIDGIEGVAGGILLMSAITFYLVAYFQHQHLFDAMNLSLVIIGLLAGRFNRTFSQWSSLGGGLSSLFGFLIAVITISGVMKRTAFLTLFIPLLVLGIPIINISYRLAVSWVSGKSEDLYYRFIYMGLGHKQVIKIIYFFNIYLCGVALFLVFYRSAKIGLVLVVVAFLLAKATELYFKRKRLKRGLLHGSIDCFGVKINGVSLSGAVSRVLSFLREGGFHQVITLNSLGVLDARKDEEFRKIIFDADLVVPDGVGVLAGARMLGYPVAGKVAGIDLSLSLIELSENHDYTVFILGSKEGVAERAKANLLREYPDAKIVGVHHGYFDRDDEVLEKINAVSPDILLVGLGMPKQEKWVYRNRDRLNVKVAIGVGGSIDVWAGVVKRAPVFFRRFGLEWLYRLIAEPWRYKRIARLPLFILLVFKEMFRRE